MIRWCFFIIKVNRVVFTNNTKKRRLCQPVQQRKFNVLHHISTLLRWRTSILLNETICTGLAKIMAGFEFHRTAEVFFRRFLVATHKVSPYLQWSYRPPFHKTCTENVVYLIRLTKTMDWLSVRSSINNIGGILVSYLVRATIQNETDNNYTY